MGIFDSLKKIIQGRPVFENPESEEVSEIESDIAQKSNYDSSGHKIIPKVLITRSNTHQNGSNMDIWARVHNQSDTVVVLKKIILIGITRQLSNFLKPGEEEEVLIYSGPRPTNPHYDRAELHFEQEETNDYFCADHVIKYDYEADDTYSVREFQPYNYIRDV